MATEANAERYVAPDGRTYITGQPPPFRGPRNSLTDAGNGRGNQVHPSTSGQALGHTKLPPLNVLQQQHRSATIDHDQSGSTSMHFHASSTVYRAEQEQPSNGWDDGQQRHQGAKHYPKDHQFTILLVVFNAVCGVLFAVFAEYDQSVLPTNSTVEGDVDPSYLHGKYPLFTDVHVMIFIGFGFLMTFLRRYGFSAVSLNLLLAAFTIQWSMIIRGLLSETFAQRHVFTLSIDEMFTADFSSAVILISFGAVLGRLSPTQYLIMALLETPASIVTEYVIINVLKVNDLGGSIIVHTFGAYFGLAASRAIYRESWDNGENNCSVYHSDLFSMVGTIFLWVFWPSFNAAVADPDDAKQRAMINTFLALIACTTTTFLVSQVVSKDRNFDMVHIQNSTLAGGVAIGTAANVVLGPSHALAIGSVAGGLSVLGYQFISPFLDSKLKIQDTCGVHNLHGMPGVLAGLASVVLVFVYNPERYGTSLATIYPAFKTAPDGAGRNQMTQALFQLAGLGAALASSIITGALTGLVLRLPFWNRVVEQELYSDAQYFKTPDDFEFTSRLSSKPRRHME
ncbi:CBN-RHR-1 protein [Aphelenchoides avenae]|nr:CBN-RHR-1 protein [Aphelenchus avenae]